MSVEVLLLLFIAAGIIVVLRLRQKLALLAEQIRSLRAHALEHVTYRPVGNVELADAVHDTTTEAEKLGFIMLGDYVEQSDQNPTERAMRWFVDAPGTTFGWMVPFEVAGVRHIIIVLMSHELDAQTITARQPPASLLGRPPFVTMQQLPVATSFAETVRRHRSKAGLDDSARAFVPVKTFDQLVYELDRMRSKVITWRQAQPADELLETDLKSLLGAQYGKLAGPLRRRLAAGPRGSR